jgi:serine/threonine protein kinase
LLADLIDKMLTLNPRERITAKDALSHEFFNDIPKACLPSEIPLFEDDYHEYVVKSEKKHKKPMKQSFTFKRTYDDSNDPSNADFWKPSLE